MRHLYYRYRHRSLIIASTIAVLLIAPPAMAQTPSPVEPPGTPGTVVFVGDVGVSIRADTGTLPRGCNPTEVVHLLTAFLDAFNRGDQESLPDFFPIETDRTQEGTFHWYSVNGPPGGFNPGFSAANRDELMPYFGVRHSHGERMTLLQIDYGTNPIRPGVPSEREIGFTLDVLRSADDIPTHQAGVKGGIDCKMQTITTWGMGDRGVVPDDWFGTPPATPAVSSASFACVPDTPHGPPPPLQPSAQLVPGTTVSTEGIWAVIPDDGKLQISERYIETSRDYEGWRGTKMMWTRGDGVVGPLIITGERLDAEAPAAVDLVYLDGRQYGTMGFTPSWPTFPSAGCWEITGSVGDHELVFTLEVVFVDSKPHSATPAG